MADLRAPAMLPESMGRDEMLRYYSEYANMVAHEVVGYQRQIRELKAALAALGVEGRAVPVRMKFGKRDDEADRAQRAPGMRVCPACGEGEDKVSTAAQREEVPYGSDGKAVSVVLAVHSCAACGQSWTDHQAEVIRDFAVAEAMHADGVKGPDDETKA